MMFYFNVLLISGLAFDFVLTSQRPNVILITADDMGWNDVSFHGSDQIQTPNLDSLAYDGIVLHNHYAYSACTPSRAALLTGRYAHRIGMQGYPIPNTQDKGVDRSYTMLQEHMKLLGYQTKLIGKWHLGHSRRKYLPNNRGFDSFFGYLGGFVDYYEYFVESAHQQLKDYTTYFSGLDLYENYEPVFNRTGYLTQLLTDEAIKAISERDVKKPLFMMLNHISPHAGNRFNLLQAPPHGVEKLRYIESLARRIYAAMVVELDEGIGKLMSALESENLLDNTIIIFMSDNGAKTIGSPVRNWGSNLPLRGIKQTPWEGGLRVPAFVWSKNITKTNDELYWNGLMHITDWLPTILSAVNGSIPVDVDGKDQWNNIIKFNKSNRSEIVLEVDDYANFSSFRYGDYKILHGDFANVENGYYGHDLIGVTSETPNYLEKLKNCPAYKVLNRLGRYINDDKVSNLRVALRVTCDINTNSIDCIPTAESPCLYNITADPCEQTDISAKHNDIVKYLLNRIEEEWSKRIPYQIIVRDAKSNPALHGNAWSPWIDDDAE